MSNVVDLNLDTDEIELKLENSPGVQKIQYAKISRLKFSEGSVKKWFKVKQFRIIEVHVRGNDTPFIISGDRVKTLEQMEPYLRQMAEKHNVIIEA
ncbi:hypothetical protein EHS13_04625 [Paenibacillus psychroresistens]|uniref:Uncharacterized protein n=1 Tax=Paenibacillus psychroresistens TaxID=1778678 RepID=A0A6B8RCN2_9BACL|nr:hypothetical protein [Paenibacillus psychroresistens]QGQ94241.1 hypothetical protein EHS13_04625 [Paenibacillus psychroresistens]